MKVGDWMSRRVVTCRAQDDANHAARLLWDEDLGCLPVVDGAGRMVGIVTDRDLFMGAYLRGRGLRELDVGACMGTHVQTCRPEDALEKAVQLMAEHQLRRLPVIDAGGALIGTFTLSDAARAAASAREARTQRILADAVCAALASVSAPRRAPRANEPSREPEPIRELAPSAAKKTPPQTKPSKDAARKR
jgi:CBS domain-containing protein